MRILLIPAFALLAQGVLPAMDDNSTPAPAPAPAPAATDATAKAVNTVDPVTGAAVDEKIAPVSAKTSDGKDILIGISAADSADAIKKDPAKYATAALANKKAE